MEPKELNAWIAENIMGVPCDHDWSPLGRRKQVCFKCGHKQWNRSANSTENYCGNPGAAMQVLKKCIQKIAWSNGVVLDKSPDSHNWIVGQEEDKHNGCQAETLELAICLFAKKIFTEMKISAQPKMDMEN